MKCSTQVLSMFFSLLLLFSFSGFAQTPGKVTGGKNFVTPDWFKESFLEIADDAEEAGESDKHLLLFFHLNGCPYCNNTVNLQFQREPIKSFMQAHFDSIEVNIKGDREIAMTADMSTTERELAKHLKIEHTPAILLLNSENKTVLRLDGYRSTKALKLALEYVEEKAYLSTSFGKYKSQHMQYGGYEFISDPMIETVTDLSAIKEPVFLLIEDDDCNECLTFHNKLINRATIRDQLAKYRVIRIDAKSNQPITVFDGRQLAIRDWVSELGIDYRPGIVLFDRGREVTRVTSMLFPYHFETTLHYGLDNNHKKHADYSSFSRARRTDLLSQGVIIDIGKPEDW